MKSVKVSMKELNEFYVTLLAKYGSDFLHVSEEEERTMLAEAVQYDTAYYAFFFSFNTLLTDTIKEHYANIEKFSEEYMEAYQDFKACDIAQSIQNNLSIQQSSLYKKAYIVLAIDDKEGCKVWEAFIRRGYKQLYRTVVESAKTSDMAIRLVACMIDSEVDRSLHLPISMQKSFETALISSRLAVRHKKMPPLYLQHMVISLSKEFLDSLLPLDLLDAYSKAPLTKEQEQMKQDMIRDLGLHALKKQSSFTVFELFRCAKSYIKLPPYIHPNAESINYSEFSVYHRAQERFFASLHWNGYGGHQLRGYKLTVADITCRIHAVVSQTKTLRLTMEQAFGLLFQDILAAFLIHEIQSAKEHAENMHDEPYKSQEWKNIEQIRRNQEVLAAEVQKEKEEKRQLEKELQAAREMLQKERKERAQLEKSLELASKNERELKVLRDYVLSNNEPVTDVQVVTLDEKIAFLNEQQLVIVGGHVKWQQKIKDALPYATMIDVDKKSKDLSVLSQQQQYIIFNTATNNHGLYERFMNEMRKNNNPLQFLHENLSLTRTIDELYTFCQEKILEKI